MDEYFNNIKIDSAEALLNNVKTIEKQIRSSSEYRKYLAFIKESLLMRGDSVFKDIDFVDQEIDLHFHHLLTLYDLVLIVGSQMISELEGDDFLFTFDIAKEVIKCHLDNLIPGVTLSATTHELLHAGLYSIPADYKNVNLGDYKTFIKKYSAFLEPKYYETLKYFGVKLED